MTRRLQDLAEASGRYGSLYVDSPWPYRDRACSGAAATHYLTMSLEALERLPVVQITRPEGARLWLWATWPQLRDGAPQRLLRAWGFTWKSEIVWGKKRDERWYAGKPGLGRRVRVDTEILLIAERGRVPPFPKNVRGFVISPPGRHSEKPEYFRELAASVGPLPMVELFARQASPLCDRWGDEAPQETLYQGRLIDLPLDLAREATT
jgi:N6-adenosine-specific RNA methylase IME4